MLPGKMGMVGSRASGASGARWWAAGVGLAIVLAWGSVLAQVTDPGEAAIRRGVDLRRQGQDDQALQEFKKAYELSPSPRALAQMGLAEQALGRWVEAETHLEAALGTPTDPWIQKTGAILRGALEKVAGHLGSVQVLGEPVGAEVLIHGNVVGRLPMMTPARVPIGEAQIEVRHPGFRASSRVVSVSAGELSRETIVLVRPISTVPNLPPATRSEMTADRPLPPVLESGATDVPASRGRRPAVWVAAGLGVAGIAVGVVETFIAVQRSKDFNHLPENCMDGGNGLIVGGARCVQADHDQTVATWVAAIGYGLGAMFGATAVVLHLTKPADPVVRASRREAAWLTCSPGVVLVGVGCTARW